jgi:pimeloyl-ACP methyl ester carboxylesterase
LTLMGRTRHVLQVAALGLGTVGLASAAYQSYAMALDWRRYPPPGDLVDIGDRKLHLLMTPGAGPPLVIVAALGTPAIDWLSIQRALATDVPVVLYDRGSIGWSDPGGRPRTAARMAEELHALLTAAHIEPPYVLAGHSLGGLIALIYTARHREHVAGLALIDSSHPDMHKRLPAGGSLISGRGEWLLRAAQSRLTPLGLSGLPMISVSAARSLPGRGVFIRLMSPPQAARSCCPPASAGPTCQNWPTSAGAATRPALAWLTSAPCPWPSSRPANTIPATLLAAPPPRNAAAGTPHGTCCMQNLLNCPATAATR